MTLAYGGLDTYKRSVFESTVNLCGRHAYPVYYKVDTHTHTLSTNMVDAHTLSTNTRVHMEDTHTHMEDTLTLSTNAHTCLLYGRHAHPVY